MKLNKVFIIVLFTIILWLLSNNSFAAVSLTDEEIAQYSDILFNYAESRIDKEAFPYYIIIRPIFNNCFSIFYCSTPITFDSSSNVITYGVCREYSYDFVNNVFNYSYKPGGLNIYSFGLTYPPGHPKDYYFVTIVSINHDIIDTKTNNVVFQQPPQVIPEEETTEKTLAEITQESHKMAKEITQEAITAELAELVPVGITILATMILVSLVAYFTFWKV